MKGKSMNDKRNASLRDALLKAVAIAAFTAVPATAFAPVASATVYLDDVNDGECDLGNGDDTGSGTSDDPYRISTVEDLAEITDCDYDGTYYYEMTNDIDITPNGNYNNDGFEWNGLDNGWSPIGQVAVWGDNDEYTTSNDFEGHFDGNGYTISGLEIWNDYNEDDYLGLFSDLDEATIMNLTIEGEIDAGDDYDDYVGMLAGGDYASTISNVHADVNIYDADDYVGGLIGYADGTRISRSSTSGTMHGWDDYTEYMGGIVGYADDDYNAATLTNVSSSVEVNDATEGENDGSWFEEVGGIVGYAESVNITKAEFTGTVFGNYRVGGIVGYADGAYINNVTVSDDVEIVAEADNEAYEIGGVVGELDYGSLNNATFDGLIDAYQADYDVWAVGGIVGSTYQSNIVGAVVTENVEISVNGYDQDSRDIGGIVGYSDETVIASTANLADIVVNNAENVGGIAGQLDASYVSGSLNRGNLTLVNDNSDFDNGSLGGIVGLLDYFSEVSTSTNKGDITLEGVDDNWGVGGIVGEADDDLVVVRDNYNTGDVTGVYNVAGIIGYNEYEEAVVSRNYSVGKLTAYDSEPDGILTMDSEETLLDASNAVLLSDGAENVTEAMELTAAELKAGADLVDAGWAISLDGEDVVDGADWATQSDFNSGYPFLVWETVSEDIVEPVGLSDLELEDVVQFNGGKRFRLTLDERNALNLVAAAINAHPFASVDLDVYYGSKFALAGKRAKAVKRYLIRRFVGAPISVHILPADGGHAVGSVHITALVD
jgi:hypothetical protein